MPRLGTGARYGQSVSRTREVRGAYSTTSLSFLAFLKVSTPPMPQIEAHIQVLPGHLLSIRKAVNHTAHIPGLLRLHDIQGVLRRVPAVDDHRKPGLPGQIQLAHEPFFLNLVLWLSQ